MSTLKELQDMVARPDAEIVQSNLHFYYGDHWQNAEGWSGPIPPSYSAEYVDVAAEIESAFVSKNTIREIVDNAVNGILGRDPKYSMTFNGKNGKKLVSEAEAIVKKWLKDKKGKKALQKALRNALMSGSSTIRLMIPSGMLVDGNVIVNEQNPLSVVFPDAPNPLSANIVQDQSTMEETGITLTKVVDESGKERDRAEVTYLIDEVNDAGNRLTKFDIIGEQGQEGTATLDLDGHLTMFELQMPRIITNQIRSLQKMQNLNLTMMQRNSVLGGFLERTILNGQLPGHYETDPDTNEKTFIRDPITIGAGTINVVNGVPVVDDNGNVTNYSNADIRYRDPVTPDTFIKASDSAYRGMLQETKQLHSLLSGDAITSGDSRRQALAAFMSSLRIPKAVVESAIEWLIETLLAFEGTLSGDATKFEGVEVKATCNLDFGAISAGEVDLLERQVRVGIISLETARERIGIEDLDGEEERVNAEVGVRKELDAQFSGDKTLDPNIDNRDVNTGA
jgi:hypothetical protein